MNCLFWSKVFPKILLLFPSSLLFSCCDHLLLPSSSPTTSTTVDARTQRGRAAARTRRRRGRGCGEDVAATRGGAGDLAAPRSSQQPVAEDEGYRAESCGGVPRKGDPVRRRRLRAVRDEFDRGGGGEETKRSLSLWRTRASGRGAGSCGGGWNRRRARNMRRVLRRRRWITWVIVGLRVGSERGEGNRLIRTEKGKGREEGFGH
ncbi:uncharacterized protein LOC128193805 [Vigna angularis]|uniref:uncharacterized protein LOC128193805 n=1 Tax=Phaseolus angularis TaxID=3914 RepID=UPI0022B316D2|nr:uncharacterized protein LOC128193805 [Vigna angularis]